MPIMPIMIFHFICNALYNKKIFMLAVLISSRIDRPHSHAGVCGDNQLCGGSDESIDLD